MAIQIDQGMIDRYLAGESELSLSKTYGVSRGTIRRHLIDSGVTPRSYSDANILRAAKLTPEQRKAQAHGAHESWRGSKMSHDDLAKKARTKQERQTNASPEETLLGLWLASRGVLAVPQQAVGVYNIDLGVYPVAIEIFGGGWHKSGKHAARHTDRCKYLLDQGWSIAILWIDKLRYPLSEAAADTIATIIDMAQNTRTPDRWWSVRGDGVMVSAETVESLLVQPAISQRARKV